MSLWADTSLKVSEIHSRLVKILDQKAFTEIAL